MKLDIPLFVHNILMFTLLKNLGNADAEPIADGQNSYLLDDLTLFTYRIYTFCHRSPLS